jgi:hypothetical protein
MGDEELRKFLEAEAYRKQLEEINRQSFHQILFVIFLLIVLICMGPCVIGALGC